MPVNFPDLNSLKRRAEMWNFRMPNEGESIEEYRKVLHVHVKPKDLIESFEILFGIGWDNWSSEQKRQAMGM